MKKFLIAVSWALLVLLLAAGCAAAPAEAPLTAPGGGDPEPSETEGEPSPAPPAVNLAELEVLPQANAVGSSCVVNTVSELGLVEVEVETPEEYIEYGAGRYKVGTNLPADIYFLIADEGQEATATVKDGTGLFAKEIFQESFASHTIVEVAAGQQLILDNCTMIHLGFSKDYFDMVDEGLIGEGMYLVGFHIVQGGYDLLPAEDVDAGYIISYSDAARAESEREKEIDKAGLYTALAGNYVWLRGATMENIPLTMNPIES